MLLAISRVDRALPLPARQSAGAAGFDLASRLDLTVEAGTIAYVPVNVVIEVPQGHVLLVTLRSSTPGRKGLLSPHGVGVIDSDYCGPEDEIKVQVYNFTTSAVAIARGERIAQGLLLPLVHCDWAETAEVTNPSRGGFGSTG